MKELYQLKLEDFSAQEIGGLNISMHYVDAYGKVLKSQSLEVDQQFELSEKEFKNAAFIKVGPSDLDPENIEKFLTFRADQFLDQLKLKQLSIPPRDWGLWLGVKRCVTGKVRKCRFTFPWWDRNLLEYIKPVKLLSRSPSSLIAEPAFKTSSIYAKRFVAQDIDRIFLPSKCSDVCDGLVEVYRRRCCHTPFMPDTPWLDRLRDLLEQHVIPPVKFPPIPDPGPEPWMRGGLFKNGTLDERTLHGSNDLRVLQELPVADRLLYIESKPYLWSFFWNCGSPTKVASGFLQPSGKFHICWNDFLLLQQPNCRYEYAYKVKQVINGQDLVVYDGVAAGKWFSQTDTPTLTTYLSNAISCSGSDGPNGVPGEYILLQDIGAAHSYRLSSPAQTTWDRVTSWPNDNMHTAGLLDPEPNPVNALGNYKNSNWGGTLRLRFKFSEGLKALNVTYYRVSVSEIGNNGLPTGTRVYLDPSVTWQYYTRVAGDIKVEAKALGPIAAPNGLNGLYAIPFDLNGAPENPANLYTKEWLDGDFHMNVNTLTSTFANTGKYAITLEVFDANGDRVRPSTAPAEASLPAAAKGFTYRRWVSESDTDEVAFSALTHVFWIDNRPGSVDIVELRKGGVSGSNQECQFITGCTTDTFSVGYRAVHPEERFHLSHNLTWVRGLNGASGNITPAAPASQQNANLGTSASRTFSELLGVREKCSFAVTIHMDLKTTDGSSRWTHPDQHETAAFALEQQPCP